MLAKLGPGLLYAGAAVGVSHLVQSTRAGAQFGFALVAVVIISNILKYPFFQVGPRYSAVTGKTLLDGYEKLGKWAVWLFLLLTLATMFVVEAAIAVVTTGLLEQLTGVNYDIRLEATLLLAICSAVLIWGRYSLLDKLIKVIIILLSLTTLVSVIGAISSYTPPAEFPAFSLEVDAHMVFLFALIGWMPAPLDISAWQSMWANAKERETGKRIGLSDALLDFNVGFIVTLVLALLFLSLGALVMYGRGQAFPNSAAAFAGQLISLYTKNLGPWAFPFIAIACFTTMFSTTLTVLDAYPRMLRKMTIQLIPHRFSDEECKKVYSFWVIVTAIGTVIIIYGFLSNMKAMVDFATVLSFVVAPVIAVLNYLVIQDKDLPAQAHFGPKMKAFCWVGFAALFGFTALYLLRFF